MQNTGMNDNKYVYKLFDSYMNVVPTPIMDKNCYSVWKPLLWAFVLHVHVSHLENTFLLIKI